MNMGFKDKEQRNPIVRELLRWFACFVFVLMIQILLVFWLFFLGMFLDLSKISEFLYAGAVSWLGKLLFDDPSVGDSPCGLLLFLLTVILYSVIAGTGLYLFRRSVSRETD